jgi:hypothetical protein
MNSLLAMVLTNYAIMYAMPPDIVPIFQKLKHALDIAHGVIIPRRNLLLGRLTGQLVSYTIHVRADFPSSVEYIYNRLQPFVASVSDLKHHTLPLRSTCHDAAQS